MPQAIESFVGQKFGQLVVRQTGGKNYRGRVMWLCRCDCGNAKEVLPYNLLSGNTKSCGCLMREVHLVLHRTHGATARGSGARGLYNRWQAMLTRCRNPNVSNYKNYGGRGISVCDRWMQFENFYADMGDPPDGASLDRIDNQGNYEPQNCRWSDRKEQNRNRRISHVIVHDGISLPISAWAEKLGVTRGLIRDRLRLGWSVERALTTPARKMAA